MVHHFTQKINHNPVPESQHASQLPRATLDTSLRLGFHSKAEPETRAVRKQGRESKGKETEKGKAKVGHYFKEAEFNPTSTFWGGIQNMTQMRAIA